MNIGDVAVFSKVRIETKDGKTVEGIFLPQEGEYCVIKLVSGYNIGVDPKNIASVEQLEAPKEPQMTNTTAPSQDTSLPKIRILHTGGTIASKVDYETGAVSNKFTPEELLSLFPELTSIAQVDVDFLGNMSSDDFRFAHFNKVAQAAHKAVKEGIDRVIVTSGTDFLHYLSAALSFLLKDVPIGVIAVGSQRSSDRGSSDAASNMICAAQFLAQSHFKGVGICMHSKSSDSACDIFPGLNTRKMHSSDRGAFKPINSHLLARVAYPALTMDLFSQLELCEGEVPESVPLLQEDLKIGIVHSHPNMHADELSAYDQYDGLILAGSGLGHFPISVNDDATAGHQQIAEKIQSLAQKMPVVMTVQTIYGRVNMNVYSSGRLLREFGVLGHQSSMITDTAYVKLAYLLSTQPDKVRELMDKDLIGEHPKTELEEYE